jgi:hypothetical protein
MGQLDSTCTAPPSVRRTSHPCRATTRPTSRSAAAGTCTPAATAAAEVLLAVEPSLFATPQRVRRLTRTPPAPAPAAAPAAEATKGLLKTSLLLFRSTSW